MSTLEGAGQEFLVVLSGVRAFKKPTTCLKMTTPLHTPAAARAHVAFSVAWESAGGICKKSEVNPSSVRTSLHFIILHTKDMYYMYYILSCLII